MKQSSLKSFFVQNIPSGKHISDNKPTETESNSDKLTSTRTPDSNRVEPIVSQTFHAVPASVHNNPGTSSSKDNLLGPVSVDKPDGHSSKSKLNTSSQGQGVRKFVARF